MNNLSVTNVEIKNQTDENNNIKVTIKDGGEFLLAAHNASPEAHKNITGQIKEEIQAIKGIINEMEDTMALKAQIPSKTSELENDIGFMNEEQLAAALEKRETVNLSTLNEKLSEASLNLQNSITLNYNLTNNKIEAIENTIATAAAPETITGYCAPGTKKITMTPTPAGVVGQYVMPADGIMLVLAKSTDSYPWFALEGGIGTNANRKTQLTWSGAGGYQAVEKTAKKGETMHFNYGHCTIQELSFVYLTGSQPEDKE